MSELSTSDYIRKLQDENRELRDRIALMLEMLERAVALLDRRFATREEYDMFFDECKLKLGIGGAE